jgi:thiamine pyrophosphokinase
VVSLLVPAGSVDGVTTEGLRFPLADESLDAGPARGLSNVRPGAEAAVTVRRGFLLVVESPAGSIAAGPSPARLTP